MPETENNFAKPFAAFAPPLTPPSPLRQAIEAACRRPEEECLPPLLAEAQFAPAEKQAIAATARALVRALRGRRGKISPVEELVQEYALSSAEGVALMCLAEALLRIPDNATRDALIRDKIAKGDWKAHLNKNRSLFVNAASWGLLIAGKLAAAPEDEHSLSGRLTALISRYSEPLIRKAVAAAVNMMGSQFVCGETIESALKAAQTPKFEKFRYSYDMLGEAAMTKADAQAYFDSYKQAIAAIGAAAQGKSLYDAPGISLKLSALHPRYSRAQLSRLWAELLPQVLELARLARKFNIGFNIDAEEADRLDISLDILEALLADKALEGWDGIGFVVQAYGRRCPYVLDYIIDAARRSKHRVMLRLVKGAYWDGEVKRAQTDGMASYPVYTRKVFTDISYIACAKKLLAAADAIFPQFATHNAQTVATIYHMAGAENYQPNQYEFQCLHGMGEPLYENVIGADKMARPVRVYAPIGSYESLLAYLVRRLLENGANSSFVHRLADESVPEDELIADPADSAAALPDLRQNDKLAAPRDIFLPQRRGSAGLDLADETCLADLSAALQAAAEAEYRALPGILRGRTERAEEIAAADKRIMQENAAVRPVLNPAERRDIVGYVLEADEDAVRKSFAEARKGALCWRDEAAETRAAVLAKAADIIEARAPQLLALMCREAGKSIANGIAEIREAADFLRYYGAQAAAAGGQPLGIVVCISPWNFPLAIFTGQIAAALAAGNGVLAKPAEETPLTAALAVEILYEAGVPRDVLLLVPGDGAVGAALVAQAGVGAVMFTGGIEAARSIARQIAGRLCPRGGEAAKPIRLIAETGGQNAMIVDSSALAEQVAADCVTSAFDSAGQRCSALRILCLQEDIAGRFLTMLKGAMAELRVGRTDLLHNDIGPVITAEAAANINAHIEAMRAKGFKITQLPMDREAVAHGHFVPPTIIEINAIADVEREIFGPVLHIIRYKRAELDGLIKAINQTGYGLTFGLHTRLNGVMEKITGQIEAGNIYINRNIIGAVVGSQPFGGRGLSGTGPKAGGPLYLSRLMAGNARPNLRYAAGAADNAEGRAGQSRGQGDCRAEAKQYLAALADFAGERGYGAIAAFTKAAGRESLLGLDIALPGPAGEENRYKLQPRGLIFVHVQSEEGLLFMLALCLAAGSKIAHIPSAKLQNIMAKLPAALSGRIVEAENLAALPPFHYALLEGEEEELTPLCRALAALDGAVIPIQAASLAEMRREAEAALQADSQAEQTADKDATLPLRARGEDALLQAAGEGDKAAPPQGEQGAKQAAPVESEAQAPQALQRAFAAQFLLEEVSISNNIVAVGGNAKLMNIG